MLLGCSKTFGLDVCRERDRVLFGLLLKEGNIVLNRAKVVISELVEFVLCQFCLIGKEEWEELLFCDIFRLSL